MWPCHNYFGPLQKIYVAFLSHLLSQMVKWNAQCWIIKNKVKLKESCFYSTYQIIWSGAKLKSSVLIGDFRYSALTGVCWELICIRLHCTNFLPQENLWGTKSKTPYWEVYWAATMTRWLRKNALQQVFAFLDVLLSFYTWFFSLPCSLWRRPRNIPRSYLTIVTTPELF